jgi:hypothetical protein
MVAIHEFYANDAISAGRFEVEDLARNTAFGTTWKTNLSHGTEF